MRQTLLIMAVLMLALIANRAQAATIDYSDDSNFDMGILHYDQHGTITGNPGNLSFGSDYLPVPGAQFGLPTYSKITFTFVSGFNPAISGFIAGTGPWVA